MAPRPHFRKIDFSSISNLRKIHLFFAESGVSSNAMKSRELILLDISKLYRAILLKIAGDVPYIM